MANWEGTLVPNSGYVENVYFNTALSTEEVVSIIESANLTYYQDMLYVVCTNEDMSSYISLMNNGNGICTIMTSNNTVIFSSDPNDNGWETFILDAGFVPLDINCVSEANGITVGLENDKLTSLFSITPFTSGEETTADKLQKLIDNKQLIVDSVNAKAGTSYDIHSKPSDIADTITNIETGGGTNTSDATATTSDILKGKTAYIADGKVEGTIETYDGSTTEGATSNLQVKNVTPSKNVQEVIPDSEYYGLSKVVVDSIPSEYIIPSGTLEIVDNGEHNVKDYEKVSVNVESESTANGLPLEVEELPSSASVEGAIYKVGGASGTAVPNSGYVENVYLNTNLSVEEVVSVLSQLTLNLDGAIECLLISNDKTIGIVCQNMNGIWVIMNQVSYTLYFLSADADMGFVGWNPDFNGIIEVNGEVSNVTFGEPTVSVGTQNEKLTLLFSTTPFGGESDYYLCENGEFIEMVMPEGTLEITEKGEYDVKELEKVNVNIESGSGEDMLQARIDSNNSCEYLFYYYNGTNVDFISNLDTSNVTSMNSMFYQCTNLTSIPLLNTSNVTSMNTMFHTCKVLTTIPLLNTSNVTDMSNMFYLCSSLTSIPELDTSKVTNMKSMFSNCGLKTISLLNTSKVDNMSYIFSSCSRLEIVEKLDTSNCTNMQGMFLNCYNLTSIPQLNTSKATNMQGMFQTCSKLTSVSQLDTGNVTDMGSIFTECKLLETIDITYYNISSTSNSSRFAYYCTALKSLIIRGFGENYVLSTDSLQKSGIANGTGYIYVPSAMVDTLKSATNWSTYASQIRALEDYTIDGTTTGALDETKI